MVQLTSFEPSGVLWLYKFKTGTAPEALDAIPDLPQSSPHDVWYWVHFASAHEQSRAAIRAIPSLTEDAVESLIHQDGGLRIDVDDRVIYGAIADYERDLSGRTKDTAKLFFALTDNLFITIRRRALYSTDHVRRMFDRGQYPSSPSDLLEMIVSRFTHVAHHDVIDLTDTLDDIEDRVLRPEVNDDRTRLIPIRSLAVRLYRQVSAMRIAFARFESASMPMPLGFQDVAASLARELESLDHDTQLLQDRARLLQDEMAAKTDSAINDSLRVLSILTSLFLPPTLIAGLFGMNVKDLPFLETPGGFWYALALCMGSSVSAYLLMKKLDIA